MRRCNLRRRPLAVPEPAFDPEGGPPVLLQKISGYVRDPRPKKIVWQPELAWKRQFYWLYWEQPERHALVVAEIDAKKNEIEVEVEGDPTGLCVLVDAQLVDFEREYRVTAAFQASHNVVTLRRSGLTMPGHSQFVEETLQEISHLVLKIRCPSHFASHRIDAGQADQLF